MDDDTQARGLICVMGIFVADLAFRTPRLPVWGETVLGSGFRMGPGGKGSNQAVAAARLAGNVAFISKVGQDSFGRMAREAVPRRRHRRRASGRHGGARDRRRRDPGRRAGRERHHRRPRRGRRAVGRRPRRVRTDHRARSRVRHAARIADSHRRRRSAAGPPPRRPDHPQPRAGGGAAGRSAGAGRLPDTQRVRGGGAERVAGRHPRGGRTCGGGIARPRPGRCGHDARRARRAGVSRGCQGACAGRRRRPGDRHHRRGRRLQRRPRRGAGRGAGIWWLRRGSAARSRACR